MTLPASACTSVVTTMERAEKLSGIGASVRADSKSRCIDIFYFNDDTLQRLDSYQRIEGSSRDGEDGLYKVTGSSRTGNKILVALANSSSDKFTWDRINSYRMLKLQMADLRNEVEGSPVMSAETKVIAGKEIECTMTLEPLLARVTLSTICCDFHQRPYAGEKLKDVKAYLTNVSSRCPYLPDSTVTPDSYINSGRYIESDLEDFSSPGMFCAAIADSIGTELESPEKNFYCYPNSGETGLGSPATMLVIEGKLQGTTYYYPIEIGRTDGDGIFRNMEYRYDVTITRRGSLNPWTKVESGTVLIKTAMRPWTEKKALTIDF